MNEVKSFEEQWAERNETKCSVVLPIASEVPATAKRDKTYALDKKTTAGKTTSTKPVLFPAAIRHLFIFQFPAHQVLKNIIKTPFTPELPNPGTMKRHQSLFLFHVIQNRFDMLFCLFHLFDGII